MTVTTGDIKNLREITGAGILDCKKALQETGGDVDQAIEFLRKKGLASASKKADREANEGVVSAQISDDGKSGVLLEVNCETDFVARTEDFQTFVDTLVQQVVAQPALTSVEALLQAPYAGNTANTVAQQLTEAVAKLGENMMVRRLARFSLEGEGMLDSYIHTGGRVGVLVEIAGSSGNNDQMAELVHDLALQIAAVAPRYVTEQDVPAEAVEAEREIYKAQLANDSKPDNIKERIVEGKLKKWYSEIVLVNQEFVKDSGLTVAQLVQQHNKNSGGNIRIRQFARFELGA